MELISITNSGIQALNRDTILQNLIIEFKSAYGNNVYIEEGTEDYNMLLTLADLLNDMGMVAVSVGNGLNLQNAVGYQLDNIATLFYNTVNRRPATKSTVNVTITGTPGTNIRNGQVIDELGGIWNLPPLVTLPSSSTETSSTNVKATYSQPGAYFISAGQISGYNSIVTPVAGWTNVVNAVDSVAGQEIESDAQFRYRLAVKAQGSSKAVANSLYTNLLANNNISNVMIWENDTNNTINFANVGLSNVPQHSICVSLYGDYSNISNDDIAQVIYNYKGTGVGTFAPSGGVGSTNTSIVNEFNISQPINFVKAQTLEVMVNIELAKLYSTSPDLTTTLQNEINNAVITFMQEQDIGSIIYANSLYPIVSEVITKVVGSNVYNITSILLDATETSVQSMYYEKPFSQSSGISITIN